MKNELDNYLCQTYPKIFADRHKPMTETCMCWGFECGDGWFNILNHLCANIQHHIDWSIKNNQWDQDWNDAVHAGLAGNLEPLEKRFGSFVNADERIQEALENGVRTVRPVIPQVIAQQVKEKFGTLRFYYQGGDDYISGLVAMAESLSGNTCETCGKPGHRTSGGWIKTACVEHGGKDLTEEDYLKQGYEG